MDAQWLQSSFKPIFSGTFTSPIDQQTVDKQTLRWSHFKQLEGGEMLVFIQNKVFPFLKSLGSEESSFAKHMSNAVFIIAKPSLLVEAINIIDNLFEEISKQQSGGQEFQDTQGDLYEYLLSEITSAGKLGQFRTPRHIIQMISELVDPKLGDAICDPACGTGGFLLGAYHHILTQHTSDTHRETDQNGIVRGLIGDRLTDERQWKHLKEKSFFVTVDTKVVSIGFNLTLGNPEEFALAVVFGRVFTVLPLGYNVGDVVGFDLVALVIETITISFHVVEPNLFGFTTFNE